MQELPELETLCYWIREREEIRFRKDRGDPKPWTDDRILRTYRFCNVHREDDTVTRWIRSNWSRWYDHPNYTLAMAMARFINWPPTLQALGFPLLWEAKYAQEIMARLEAQGNKLWTSAYIVSTNGVQMPKQRYITEYVLTPIAKAGYSPAWGDTLVKASANILNFYGISNFMAGQIVADLKNTKHHPLSDAPDFKTWCVSGPGSLRGLNRLLGQRKEKTIPEHVFRAHVNELREIVEKRCGVLLDAQDMQNCLCEFDKFVRTRNNEGRPRQKYAGDR